MPALMVDTEFGGRVEFEELDFPTPGGLESLVRAVHERTNRMIGDLKIDISPVEVVLWGHTRAYYYKQLASHAILEVLPGFSVLNEIEVL